MVSCDGVTFTSVAHSTAYTTDTNVLGSNAYYATHYTYDNQEDGDKDYE